MRALAMQALPTLAGLMRGSLTPERLTQVHSMRAPQMRATQMQASSTQALTLAFSSTARHRAR